MRSTLYPTYSDQALLQTDTRRQRLVKTTRAAPRQGEGSGEARPARHGRVREKSVTPAQHTSENSQQPAESAEGQQDLGVAPPSRASAGNGPLFDALLMAARGDARLKQNSPTACSCSAFPGRLCAVPSRCSASSWYSLGCQFISCLKSKPLESKPETYVLPCPSQCCSCFNAMGKLHQGAL